MSGTETRPTYTPYTINACLAQKPDLPIQNTHYTVNACLAQKPDLPMYSIHPTPLTYVWDRNQTYLYTLHRYMCCSRSSLQAEIQIIFWDSVSSQNKNRVYCTYRVQISTSRISKYFFRDYAL